MTDLQCMRQALRLARRGEGRVEPNPMVGCVIARDGEVLGAGHHATFGGPHAEIEALDACRRAGHAVAGATVYVTLEPCCHTGKTPPCTEALLAARPGRVVVAHPDPAPHAAGAGLEMLLRGGITVDVGVAAEEAARLLEPYVKRVSRDLPWIVAKWAQTLDGHIATRTGDSRWISSERSRRHVHRLRARVDAVMVGIGTVLADDPQLTARGVPLRRRARRVVVDPQLRLADDAALLADPSIPVTVAAGPDASPQRIAQWRDRGTEVFVLPAPSPPRGTCELASLFRHLADVHGATNVLVEGGSSLLGSLLEDDLIDQFLVYTAPLLLGDAAAVTALRGATVDRISAAPRLRLIATRRLGDDVLLDYRRDR